MAAKPWLVAGWIILTALISLVAFLYSKETRDIDIAAPAIGAPRPAGPKRTGPPTPAGIPHEAGAN